MHSLWLPLLLMGVLLAFVIVLGVRRMRAIASAGFQVCEKSDQQIVRLMQAVFELQPRQVYRKRQADALERLVELHAKGTEDPDPTVLVYPLQTSELPEIALLRSYRSIPAVFRRLSGGLVGRLRPASETEIASPKGTKWFVYRDPDDLPPKAVTTALCESATLPEGRGLYGIALTGGCLIIWTDRSVRSLLAAGPKIHARLLKALSKPR
jgi:hypothetical protein